MKNLKILFIFVLVSMTTLLTSCNIDNTGPILGVITSRYCKLEIEENDVVIGEYDSLYKWGSVIELKTTVIFDADIEVYLNGRKVPKTHYDSDYWGYKFVADAATLKIEIKIVDGFKSIAPNYYDVLRMKSQDVLVKPDFVADLKLEEPYIYMFEDFSEFLHFISRHFGMKLDFAESIETLDGVYQMVLVTRYSNYDSHINYYDFRHQGDSVTICEDYGYSQFLDIPQIQYDFIYVTKVNLD